MTKSNAEGFILLLFDGQTGFTRLWAAGKGQPKLYPLLTVCKSIPDRLTDREKERERERESFKLESEKELLQKELAKPKNKTNSMAYL